MSVKQIDPKQTYDTLQKDPNAIYLDVRTSAEFESGHVPGAVNIPVMSPDPLSRRMTPMPARTESGGAARERAFTTSLTSLLEQASGVG